MDGFIPLSIKFLVGGRVPPILIELSMVQFCNFSKNIGYIFEGEVKK